MDEINHFCDVPEAVVGSSNYALTRSWSHGQGRFYRHLADEAADHDHRELRRRCRRARIWLRTGELGWVGASGVVGADIGVLDDPFWAHYVRANIVSVQLDSPFTAARSRPLSISPARNSRDSFQRRPNARATFPPRSTRLGTMSHSFALGTRFESRGGGKRTRLDDDRQSVGASRVTGLLNLRACEHDRPRCPGAVIESTRDAQSGLTFGIWS